MKKRINPTREKVQKYYKDRRNWTSHPPSIRKMVKELGLSLATVHKYVAQLSTGKTCRK